MKSGTTSLYEYLCSHPEISRCNLRKQVNFYSDDELWSRGIEWYQDQWSYDPSLHRWALEASPAYTEPHNAEKCAKRMASVNAEFQLIYLVRDPFERIRSHFYHYKQRGIFPEELSLSQALRTRPSLVEVSRYYQWVAAYDRFFTRDNVFLLTLEALAEHPDKCLSDICRFLEIDDQFAFPNDNKRYNSRKVQRWHGSFVHSLRSIQLLRRLVRSLLPLDVRNRLKGLFAKGPSPETGYPELMEKDRRYIREQLTEDLNELRQDARVSIDHWSIYRAGESTESSSI